MAETKTFDLLCNEESRGLCFEGGDSGIESFDYEINGGKGGNAVAESEPLIPLPCLSDESFGWMIEREGHHLPRQDYVLRLRNGDLDSNLRCEALDWIIKACSYHKFNELCLYSAMNFLDRFLSVYNLPGGKPWVIHLLAVSCLSLSAKIHEINVPCIVDLQIGDPKFVFEGKTVQRMEILVLNWLNWNMNACTPFSFIDYFLRKATMGWDQIPERALIARSIEIVSSMTKGIGFLEFRASEIAAAVVVFVSDEIQAIALDKALFGCTGVEKGRVAKCLEMVRGLVSGTVTTSASTVTSTSSTTTMISNGDNGALDPRAFTDATSNATSASNSVVTSSCNQFELCDASDTTTTTTALSVVVPPSSNGVLDATFFRYKSGGKSVESCPSSSYSSQGTKRRKMDHMTPLSGGGS